MIGAIQQKFGQQGRIAGHIARSHARHVRAFREAAEHDQAPEVLAPGGSGRRQGAQRDPSEATADAITDETPGTISTGYRPASRSCKYMNDP